MVEGEVICLGTRHWENYLFKYVKQFVPKKEQEIQKWSISRTHQLKAWHRAWSCILDYSAKAWLLCFTHTRARILCNAWLHSPCQSRKLLCTSHHRELHPIVYRFVLNYSCHWAQIYATIDLARKIWNDLGLLCDDLWVKEILTLVLLSWHLSFLTCAVCARALPSFPAPRCLSEQEWKQNTISAQLVCVLNVAYTQLSTTSEYYKVWIYVSQLQKYPRHFCFQLSYPALFVTLSYAKILNGFLN